MIYKGSSGLKAYVGSTGVDKMYKGDVLVYSSAPIPLPYDAEVEYLETDGTAYIDTGIAPSSIRPILEVEIYRKNFTSIVYPVGSDGSGNTRFSIGIVRSASTELRIGSYKQLSAYKSQVFYKIKLNSITGQGHIDDTLVWTGTKNAATNTYPILLFTSTNSTGGVRTIGAGVRIAWCKIWDNETLVADYIPVRVGQVGYFYDKVTRTLKGNAADSGAFVLGADVSS